MAWQQGDRMDRLRWICEVRSQILEIKIYFFNMNWLQNVFCPFLGWPMFKGIRLGSGVVQLSLDIKKKIYI